MPKVTQLRGPKLRSESRSAQALGVCFLNHALLLLVGRRSEVSAVGTHPKRLGRAPRGVTGRLSEGMESLGGGVEGQKVSRS